MTIDCANRKPCLPGTGLMQKNLSSSAIKASPSPGWDPLGGSEANIAAALRTESTCCHSRYLSSVKLMQSRADGPQQWYISMALGAWSIWLTKFELDDKSKRAIHGIP